MDDSVQALIRDRHAGFNHRLPELKEPIRIQAVEIIDESESIELISLLELKHFRYDVLNTPESQSGS
jgi:hypothetical protein